MSSSIAVALRSTPRLSLMEQARSVYQEHRPVLAIGLAYIAAGGAVLTFLERPWPVRLWSWLTAVWLVLSLPVLVRPSRLTLRRVLSALLVVLLVVPAQITFQSLKQAIGPTFGFWADAPLHRVDVWLHGGMAYELLAGVLHRPRLVAALDWLYMSWFIALFAFLAWVSWSTDRHRRQQALVALLLMWIVAGTVLAASGASAGPCYYERVVPGPNPYAELIARLDSASWARTNQRNLWAIHESGGWSPLAGISAMPSLHVGIAVLFALVAWGRSRALGIACWAYAGLIQVGSVVLAWHYAVDGYVGAVAAIACWATAHRCLRYRVSTRERCQSA